MRIFNFQFSYFRRGFTTVELLVIIGIIGILTSIGIPALRVYRPDLQLSGATRELVTDLRYAEQLAVTEQVDHGIRFFSSTEYQIIRYGPPEEILESKVLDGVNFQQITGLTDDQVIFNPYGAAKKPGTVTLINTKNLTTTIDIRPSGFVKVIK